MFDWGLTGAFDSDLTSRTPALLQQITMKKTIAMHEQKDSKQKADDGVKEGAVPAYLLDRDQVGGCFFAARRVPDPAASLGLRPSPRGGSIL